MPQSISRIFVHIVFSTKNRAKLIAPEIEKGLFGYIHGVAANNNAHLIIANGAADHIHLLISLPKKIDIPELIGDIKRASSRWIKSQNINPKNFYWQRGYGAFSVGQTEIEVVENYIASQKEHHKDKDFKEEYRSFLTKYSIDFDERYVWD
ncbi:MAG: IS200/IS605 family transposase [Pyrinomonadaceae bacterium]|nr:IS200/IS605 family transposase [Pyrinomonadaceae bacterium]